MRTFFRMWVSYLAGLAFLAPILAAGWSVARLFDAYAVPTWIGGVFIVLFSTAFAAWVMTSAWAERRILAMMKWVEKA